jgi:hypothetical protein
MRIDSISNKELFSPPETEEVFLDLDPEEIEIEEVVEKEKEAPLESDSQETTAGSDCESDSGREQNPHSEDDLIIFYP